MRERALRAAREVARELGLRCDDAVVLRDLGNTLVHLRPTRVVARVATTTGRMRPGDAWLARELAIASYLRAAGLPVVPPCDEIAPGPHQRGALVLSLWRLVDLLPTPPDPAAAGRALRACHEALRDFPGELPQHAAMREARRILEMLVAEHALDADSAKLLRAVAARVERELSDCAAPLQPLHGDAHLGNVLNTAEGPLWGDWEDAFCGPLEWDLACLLGRSRIHGRDLEATAAAFAAWGATASPELLEQMLLARGFQAAVWGAVIARDHPTQERSKSLARGLGWLRERLPQSK